MRRWVILIAVFCLAACASMPIPRQIQNIWVIDQSVDATWQATLEVLTELNLNPVAPTERASGMIITSLSIIPENRTSCWDCGKLNWTQFKAGHRGKFTIFVKPIGELQTELKVISHFEMLFTDVASDSFMQSRLEHAVKGDTIFSRPCVSTGQFEREIYDLVSAKVK